MPNRLRHPPNKGAGTVTTQKSGRSRTLNAVGVVQQENLFQAALDVAVRDGFGKVTLASVARHAGVSKGGLLYHFSTKNELIAAMLQHYRELAIEPAPQASRNRLAVAALIAAAENPGLLDPIADCINGSPLQRQAETGIGDNASLSCQLVRCLQLTTPQG